MPDEIGIYAHRGITAVAAISCTMDPLRRDAREMIFLDVFSYFAQVPRDFLERFACGQYSVYIYLAVNRSHPFRH
jgi:hypothetical protein